LSLLVDICIGGGVKLYKSLQNRREKIMNTEKIIEFLEEYAILLEEIGKDDKSQEVEEVLNSLDESGNVLLTPSEAIETYRDDCKQVLTESKEMVKTFDDYPEKVKEIWLNGVAFACSYIEGREDF